MMMKKYFDILYFGFNFHRNATYCLISMAFFGLYTIKMRFLFYNSTNFEKNQLFSHKKHNLAISIDIKSYQRYVSRTT